MEKTVICNPFTFSFRSNDKNVDLRKATSKQVYKCIKNEKVSLFCNVPRINTDIGIENILHLFWECELIKAFWLKLELWCENKLQVSRFQFEKDNVFLWEVGGEPFKKLHNYAGKKIYLSMQM